MPKYYPLDEKTHREAHEGISFSEYRSDEPDYRAEVDAVYKMAAEAAERDPKKAEKAYYLADLFARKYADWLNKQYRIDAMCPSVMIAGPSNFPVHKKQKQNEASMRHWEEYKKIEAIKERIENIGQNSSPIVAGDANAVDKLRAKLERLEAQHQQMKDENAAARKEGREAPHPRYAISNSRQNIASTKKRLEQLEAQKERGIQKRTVTILDEEVTVVENTEIMRLQLIFDGKPADDVRAALKKNGFRWSPRNEAWQRQLTDNAQYALRRLEKEGER